MGGKMAHRITSFKLTWYDCGLCCADDVVQERIVVSRNKKAMVFKRLNGYGETVSTEEIQIDKPMVEEFFTFLDNSDSSWATDYSVEVCDGSAWEVMLRYNSHKTRKIQGTIEYPPCGPEIEKFIISFIEQAQSMSAPIMFGCAEID